MIKTKIAFFLLFLCFVLGCSETKKSAESQDLQSNEPLKNDSLDAETTDGMDWKKVTNHLYENINPVNGSLNSYYNDQYYEPFINFIVEFDMNEFMYEDPFYGEQKSTSPFNMFVELYELTKSKKIKGINELENLTIINREDMIYGAFSNSLDVVIHEINFGRIKGNVIAFEMHYSLTNSDSYGMMSGTRAEHLQSSGKIKIDLSITKLVVSDRKNSGKEIEEKIKQLDKAIYDVNSYMSNEVDENEYEKRYEIDYKTYRLQENEQPRRKIVL